MKTSALGYANLNNLSRKIVPSFVHVFVLNQIHCNAEPRASFVLLSAAMRSKVYLFQSRSQQTDNADEGDNDDKNER